MYISRLKKRQNYLEFAQHCVRNDLQNVFIFGLFFGFQTKLVSGKKL